MLNLTDIKCYLLRFLELNVLYHIRTTCCVVVDDLYVVAFLSKATAGSRDRH